MSIFLFLGFLSPLIANAGGAGVGGPSFIDPTNAASQEPLLMINNRPLAKINGKVISLYDVIKKMDLFLYDYYPDQVLSVADKYQYYMSRWEATLEDMINDELILLDAEQKEVKISDGEVREELEERFGPNIMSNLDKVNLEYEEAREMTRNDIIVRQLIGMKVHSKAFQTVTPKVIKSAYEDYLEKNPPEDEWKYRVLSIRGKDSELNEKLATRAYTLLSEEGYSLEEVATTLDGEEGVVISLSDDYSGPTKNISKLHLQAIKALTSGSYSSPISQVSRVDKSVVLRIFHLKEMIKNLPETFGTMHDKLKNELLYKISDKEKEAYITLLKKRFGYDVLDPKFELPEDYRPFVIL